MLDSQGMTGVAAAMAMAASLEAAKPAVNLFYPMNEFYERSGVPLPPVVRVEGCDVPEPYRSLLVHDRDMTPTLAEAYQRNMLLRILQRFLDDKVFSREIVLEAEGDSRIVVYAAIKIYLGLFPPEAKRLILEGKTPFGTVLQRQGIVHTSRPLAFFRVPADDVIKRALGLRGHPVLYGRRNALLNAGGVPLAQVLEIVPPALL
jgi:chorismate-pyruvate lyase